VVHAGVAERPTKGAGCNTTKIPPLPPPTRLEYVGCLRIGAGANFKPIWHFVTLCLGDDIAGAHDFPFALGHPGPFVPKAGSLSCAKKQGNGVCCCPLRCLVGHRDFTVSLSPFPWPGGGDLYFFGKTQIFNSPRAPPPLNQSRFLAARSSAQSRGDSPHHTSSTFFRQKPCAPPRKIIKPRLRLAGGPRPRTTYDSFCAPVSGWAINSSGARVRGKKI